MTAPLIVAGMHRSGTSLVAAMLASLGVDMGGRQLAADRNNRRGYFEDLAFLTLNRRMLAAATPTDDRGHPDWGWTESERLDANAFAAFREEAQALVERQAQGAWGWKDPRNTLTLDFWASMLPDARYVLVYRQPWAVADSMQRLGAEVFLQHPEYAYSIWRFYNRRLLEFHLRHAGRSMLLSAEALVRRPGAIFTLLRDRFDLEVEQCAPATVVDPELLHCWPADDPLIPLVGAAHPECVELLAELDDVADLSGAGLWLEPTAAEPGRQRPNPSAATEPPRLSVVIPCHDQGEFLLEAVASVARSITVPYELIIVNDGSRQARTLEVLQTLRQLGHRIVDQENAGLAVARNRGFDLARAPYVLPLDADNRLRPGFVPEALRVLAERPAVGAVYGDRQDFGLRDGRVDVPPVAIGNLLTLNYIDACALLRKEVWSACGGYDPSMPSPGWEDWDLWLGAIERGWELHHLPVVSFDYRVRPGSMLTALQERDRLRRQCEYVSAKHPELYRSQLAAVLSAAQLTAAELLNLQRNEELATQRVRAQYEAVVDQLTARLADLDRRLSGLGSELEQRHVAHQEETSRLRAELEGERLRHENEAADADRRATQVAARYRSVVEDLQTRLFEFDARVRELGADIERRQEAATAEADGLRARNLELANALNQAHAELSAIWGSKMWRAWTAYHRVRHGVLRPLASARRTGEAWLAQVSHAWSAVRPAAAAGWLYLAAWTAKTWLGAGCRRTMRALARPLPAEPDAGVPSLARRPRLLIVSPYRLYPLDHGGGVRIYNLVRRLAQHCDIHLLVFYREDEDRAQRAALEPLVKTLHFHRWEPSLKPDRLGLEPRSAQLFESPAARAKINEILSLHNIDILQLEYTELGQYGLPRFARVKVVLTEIDITFRSRARRRKAGMHRRYPEDRLWGYSRGDWMRQLRYELSVARRADQVHVMSDADGACLAQFLPGPRSRIVTVPNAVDLEEFHPAPPGPRPRQLLFVGNFGHLPNLDALAHLLSDIWPEVRHRVPDARLVIAGAGAEEALKRCRVSEGVTAVESVAAMAPFYQQSRALAAPIRAGSGTRLKILEALACATPVVTTTTGAEGIVGAAGEHFLIADDCSAFVEMACRVLLDDQLCQRLGEAGRRLVESRYGWDRSVEAALRGYARLLDGSSRPEAPPLAGLKSVAGDGPVDVSVVIPTRNGGEILDRCLAAVRAQRTAQRIEIVCVDSGSSAGDLATMERRSARIVPVEPAEFNHGLTRDVGAANSRGRILVFLNQDAVPADELWLDRITAPFFDGTDSAAVQGAIAEVPDATQRFYWDSCGERFYFTSESRRWIERYFGLGFSTVNAAIRRDVWERHPFGYAQFMEDKKWQRAIVEAGYGIAVAPLAVVHHTHNYDLRGLLSRCQNEGFGWRLVGETYSLPDMLADLLRPRVYADLVRGVARGQVRSWAELLFPLLRPLLVFRGNRAQELRA